MPPSKHALLSASSAKRWMTCTPSARWEATLPDSDSPFAAEGTVAHALAEEMLTCWLNRRAFIAADSETIKNNASIYSSSMNVYVHDYVEKVTAAFEQYALAGKEPRMYLEQKVNFSQWVPEGFGTSDVVIVADNVLHIIDLKYGKGVPVDAEGNPQLRCYALGAYQAFKALEDFDTVTMEIIQPRLDSDTVETLALDDLLIWAAEELRPKAEMAYRGEGLFHPTDEACRFCKGRNQCRYNAAKQLELGRIEGGKGPEMSPTEIAGVLERVDSLTKWASGLKEWALEQAVNHGAAFPGFKLVTGRSNRIISDKNEAVAKLEAAGYGPDQTCTLLGLSDLEKIVGKKQLADVLDDLIIKPDGKPTLVKDSDKRPALDLSAQYNDYFKE